ncbi:MAG: hypothetical protein JW895_05180 [Thermoleophilaceae bacterium]|nr:hypothetical protein [Thermoleophilaceae bacterium]
MRHLMWGVCGAAVLLYIFLAALGAFEPGEAVEVTVAAVALAVVFLVHEWRGQFRAEHLRH